MDSRYFTVPKHSIDFIVSRTYVGTDPEVVAADIRNRCAKLQPHLTPAQIERCAKYAKEAHARNLRLYGFVMGGQHA